MPRNHFDFSLLFLSLTVSFSSVLTIFFSTALCKGPIMAAEFVGGSILAAVIEVLAKRLSTPEILGFFKSHKLNGGVLEKMEETLNTLNGLLDDAEEKQITRPAVKKWLDDARHAVYEAEDLMEVIDYERLRSKDKAASRRVRNRVSMLILKSFLRNI